MGKMKSYLADLECQCDDIMQETKDENPDITFAEYSDLVYETCNLFIPDAHMMDFYIEDQLAGYYHEETSHTPAYKRLNG